MPVFLTYAQLFLTLAATSEAADVVTVADWQQLIDAFTAQINVSTIVAILAAVIAAALGLVFFWWGARKSLNALMSAALKGKLRI